MGETRKDALQLDFDHRLKLEFHGTRVTSDTGLLAYCDLDEALGLTSAIDSELRDIRTAKNTQHDIAALLRQSIYSRLTGYDDTNDTQRLALDPAMRYVAGGKVVEHSAASTSVMSRFETEILAQPKNLESLMNLPGRWVDRVNEGKGLKEIVLDMDSSVSPTYGNQEGSAYNGYFECTCYHPLFCFNQFGDMERALLRNGNAHSADDWRRLLEPIVSRYRGYDILRFFRGDAAFADLKMYRHREAERYFYAIRLKANQILDKKIEHMLTRPVAPPTKEACSPISQFSVSGSQLGHSSQSGC